MGRRAKTGSLLLLAVGVAGAAAIHRTTHGRWFPRPGTASARPARAGAWVSWNRIPVGSPIEGFSGDRPDDVWAWASSGIMHWDGRSWTRVPGPGAGAGSVTGAGEWFGTLWVRTLQFDGVSGYTVRRDWCRVGQLWKRADDCDIRLPVNTPAPTPPGPPPEAAYLGAKELARFGSEHAGRAGLPPIEELTRGYRVGGGELWAVDKTGRWLTHFDGGSWTAEANRAPAFTGPIWFADEDQGWAVGEKTLYRWDGHDWMAVAAAPNNLRSIWGAAADDVWAVGGGGLVMHFDGRTWSREHLFGGAPLTMVVGRARDDVWIAGRDGRGFAAHWDGRRWTPRTSDGSGGAAAQTDATDRFADEARAHGGEARAVWARASDDVWVVGSDGLVLHYDGRAWTREDSGTDENLVGIHGAGDTIWVVGAEGALLRRKL